MSASLQRYPGDDVFRVDGSAVGRRAGELQIACDLLARVSVDARRLTEAYQPRRMHGASSSVCCWGRRYITLKVSFF